ncbi:bifunctional nuclease 2 isoform X2 [Cicer arietinum]|uniref:bifunctional nuclease 2 isoform X2 n=1 Tax=Cicer arietinum TaxID=3827 RepID=UPI003CC69136
MLRSRFSIQPLTGVGSVTTADHTNATTSRSLSFDFSPLQLPPLRSRRCCFRKAKSILISCNSSRSRSSFGDLHNNNNNNNDFLEASLLLSGKIAIEKLIDAEAEQESEDCPDRFQFVNNLVERLDHEVLMVRITERVVSTYFAKLYLSQPGKSDIIGVDARPSDAINVANRCKAPIYVSKQIVFTDAIRLGYGMGRVHNKKAIYDVLLDSPIDGPDSVAEELSMMHNMHLAIKQERFNDAAIWRDKLENLRKSSHEH